MSGYSPMGKSDKFNNLAIAYSLIPSSISLGLGNKRITPKGISNRGFSVHAPSSEAATQCVEYVVMINDTLTTKHYPAADWIIISKANIATFYKIANFFAFYLESHLQIYPPADRYLRLVFDIPIAKLATLQIEPCFIPVLLSASRVLLYLAIKFPDKSN